MSYPFGVLHRKTCPSLALLGASVCLLVTQDAHSADVCCIWLASAEFSVRRWFLGCRGQARHAWGSGIFSRCHNDYANYHDRFAFVDWFRHIPSSTFQSVFTLASPSFVVIPGPPGCLFRRWSWIHFPMSQLLSAVKFGRKLQYVSKTKRRSYVHVCSVSLHKAGTTGGVSVSTRWMPVPVLHWHGQQRVVQKERTSAGFPCFSVVPLELHGAY